MCYFSDFADLDSLLAAFVIIFMFLVSTEFFWFDSIFMWVLKPFFNF